MQLRSVSSASSDQTIRQFCTRSAQTINVLHGLRGFGRHLQRTVDGHHLLCVSDTNHRSMHDLRMPGRPMEMHGAWHENRYGLAVAAQL